MPVIGLFSTSDIAFLLLIFIMLVSLINYRQVVQIDFAQAERPQRLSEERNLEIWVDHQGGVYLDGRRSTLAHIQGGVRATQEEGARVHIIADRHTLYHHVHEIINLLQEMQYHLVSLVVRGDLDSTE